MNSQENYKKRIEGLFEQLKNMNEEEVSQKDYCKWSKKEILGHLCDSAINNIYRFMHLQKSDQVFEVVKYEQEIWVEQAAYQDRNWSEICMLWYSLNSTILHICKHLSTQPELQVNIDGKLISAQFIIQDYFTHLNHHVQQILSNEKA